MTIISILIAFTLCHFVRELRHLRRFEWVSSFTSFCNDKFKKLPGWSGPTGFLVIIGLPLVAAYIVNNLVGSVLGHLGQFIFAIAILIYTFGPRDLDIDVRKVITADDEEQQKESLEALLDGPIPADQDTCQTVAIDAPGESLEDAVVREVYEEVQVHLEDIRYVSSQPWPFPASAMCGFYAEAVDRNSSTSEEVEETRWFTVKSLTHAVLNDEVRLSPPVSIAFRLLADWFRQNGGGSLEELVRRQRAMNVPASTC